ncbi:DUF1194 domain-containing protein [Pleurocapsa sp. PCC 7319]|uniref:DUF1194 domain-containing protein n=1 Tax=Pleurocapsa sp. PCC 7319 TaxID=118161 RepID=UPI0003489A2F|nr:DUF1194 domain-containing protein [Pleurocapsa sp. PCC 7319]
MFHTNTLKKITTGSLLTFMALSYLTAKTDTAVATGSQIDVSAELMLSIDISGSVNSDEYNLQMDGYAAAFRDSEVISTIESLPNGLAVGVQFWARRPAPAQPWRVIKTEQESLDFANYLDNLARPSSSTTSIYQWNGENRSVGSGTNVTGAITAATSEIVNNDYDGDVLVIDVSGDGRSNGSQHNGNTSKDGYCSSSDFVCQGVKNARDTAENLGITINGLPIENGTNTTYITDFYIENVKSGTKGFVETAAGFDDFTRAAKAKIYQEISGALDPNAQDDVISTDENTVATYNLIAGDPNNANAGQDTDPNGDNLTVTKFYVNGAEKTVGQQITMPSGALLTVASNGDVTYDPNGLFESFSEGDQLPAPDELTYVVSDPSGYTDGATATLNINGVADDPDAVDDAVTTDEDTITSIDVLANDTDVDSESSELSVAEINGSAASPGMVFELTSGATVTLNSDGTLDYDPTSSNVLQLLNDGNSQDEIFTYTVSDEVGNTDTADVTVTVQGITDTFAD